MARYPAPVQLDVDDVLELIYEEQERAGMRLDSELEPCADCPDPALCQAEAYCQRGES